MLPAVYEANFSFEYGTGVFLWMYDSEDEKTWGGNPLDETQLSISDGLRAELARLGTWYEQSLDWSDPDGPWPWRQDECDRFTTAARDALTRLRYELSPEWEIIDNLTYMTEDADLDRHLPADPHNS